MSVWITRQTHGELYRLTKSLSSWEVQNLDASDVSGIKVINPLDMMGIEVAEHECIGSTISMYTIRIFILQVTIMRC